MIHWEPVAPRAVSRAVREDDASIILAVYRVRAESALSARISFPDGSVHPFSGPFASPRGVAVSRSADGSRFLVDAAASGPFRAARTGKLKALCVFFPWRWEEPKTRLVLVPEAVGTGVVQYLVREPSAARVYVPPAVSALAANAAEVVGSVSSLPATPVCAPGTPAALAGRALAAKAAKVVGSVSSLPAAPVCAPETPLVASRDAIASWASQRGLPHSPFVLDQVNKKRRALGLAPFALPERALR